MFSSIVTNAREKITSFPFITLLLRFLNVLAFFSSKIWFVLA